VGSIAGQERQVLVGTGLYNLHAYGPLGMEPTGWPKFTGGWQQATPAIGDADGDGDLDVTTVTREGWSFLWDTDSDDQSDGADDGGDTTDDGIDACDSSNDEWWTFHHDEHSSNNYRHDGRPPGTATGLLAAGEAGGGVQIAWTPPGDDWLCADADRFAVIVSTGGPIERATDGQIITTDGAVGPDPPQTFELTAAQAAGVQHVGVLHRDESGNWGLVKSAPVENGDPDGDGINNADDNCPAVPNPGTPQPNRDGDEFGDACEPDTDGDGINDDDVPFQNDNCDNVENTDQADADGDQIGDVCEPDTDGDGIDDDNGPENDNCDTVPNQGQADLDNDAQGDACDPDDDGDTVNDTSDNCPVNANPDQANADGDGQGDVCDSTPNGQPAAAGACANRKAGTTGNDLLAGTESSDLIRGLRGRDRIDGLGGDDCLFGNKGGDRIDGGAGGDTISGGNSRDRVIGGAGADTIRTGTGPDSIRARDGDADTIDCGSARDRVVADKADTVRRCEVVKAR
jgi:hypothetical protein